MRGRISAVSLALLISSGCLLNSNPGTPTPPAVDRVINLTVLDLDGKHVQNPTGSLQVDEYSPAIEGTSPGTGRLSFTIPAAMALPHGAWLVVDAEGFVRYQERRVLSNGQPELELATLARPPPAEPEPVPPGRSGIVSLNGHVFADDRGQFLATGASLFWGGWGYTYDRERLTLNLQFLADHGVDYVRVLAVVGFKGDPSVDAWSHRTIDPREPSWDAAIAGTTDLVCSLGMRVEWTVFGETDTTPTAADRRAVVARLLAALQDRRHCVQHVEAGNESWQNGIQDLAELNALTKQIGAAGFLASATTPDPRTPPFPEDGPDPTRAIAAVLRQMYAGVSNPIATFHLDRNISGQGLMWRPVRQAWDPQFMWTAAWTSNEPIGAASSVAADSDPLRLSMSAVLVWGTHGAGYVWHTGSGVFGDGKGHATAGPRPANLWDVPNAVDTLERIRRLKALLPADLPNWTTHNTNNRFPGYPFDTDPLARAVEGGTLLRAFCDTNVDGRFWCFPLQLKTAIPFKPRAAMHVELLDANSGAVIDARDLQAGETWMVPPGEAYLMRGQR